MRSLEITRLYVQCDHDDDISAWHERRIWDELHARLAVPGWSLNEGTILNSGITGMRSFVVEPMQYRAALPRRRCGHIVRHGRQGISCTGSCSEHSKRGSAGSAERRGARQAAARRAVVDRAARRARQGARRPPDDRSRARPRRQPQLSAAGRERAAARRGLPHAGRRRAPRRVHHPRLGVDPRQLPSGRDRDPRRAAEPAPRLLPRAAQAGAARARRHRPRLRHGGRADPPLRQPARPPEADPLHQQLPGGGAVDDRRAVGLAEHAAPGADREPAPARRQDPRGARRSGGRPTPTSRASTRRDTARCRRCRRGSTPRSSSRSCSGSASTGRAWRRCARRSRAISPPAG